jgi:hypothetical protein
VTDETDWLRDRLLTVEDRVHAIDKDMAVQKVLRDKAPDDADLDKLEAKIGREMRQYAEAGKLYTDTAIGRALESFHEVSDRQSADLKSAFRSDLKESMLMLAKTQGDAEKETRRKIIRYGIIFAGILTSLITAILSGAPAEFFRNAGHFIGAF